MFRVTANFRDENQPSIHAKSETMEAAHADVVHFARQFAGLRGITLEDDTGALHVFRANGEYFCTVEKVARDALKGG